MKDKFKILNRSHANAAVNSIVGMGVYQQDRLEWVKEAVSSILHQSYENFHFFVIIDGSIDAATKEFLIRRANNSYKMTLIQSEFNIGLSACMNHIIEMALKLYPSVEFFFRMDADDISEIDRLKKQVKFLNKNKEVSVLGTSLVEIDETGVKVGKRELPTADHQIKRILPRRCAINHPTVAIRTEVFRAGFRYRTELRNTQDYFLWAELSAAGYQFANLPEALLEFRRVNDFYKRRGLSKSINEFKARFYTMKLLKRHSLGNIIYAFSVLFLRLMPAKLVKLAYKIDRYLLNKRVRQE